MTFKENWLAAVERKGSVLCAGLDPAEFAMGRDQKGLARNDNKVHWAGTYLEAVAPYCAAVKPNIQYWKGKDDGFGLDQLAASAREYGMVVIDDSKLADIGSTNDAGMFYSAQRADAVTFSPFAGNMQEASRQAHERGLGLISMVLMSNPEYAREKNKLVRVDELGNYRTEDTVRVDGGLYVPQHIQLAHDAQLHGVDGIVVGAPSEGNHITPNEIRLTRIYYGSEGLVLMPGVGAQGGEAQAIWEYFGQDNVIVNVGRAMMFPKGPDSGIDDWKEVARHYKDMLNELRTSS